VLKCNYLCPIHFLSNRTIAFISLPPNTGTLSISGSSSHQIASFIFISNLSVNQNHFSEIKLRIKLACVCQSTCNFPCLIWALLFTTHLHADRFKGGGCSNVMSREQFVWRVWSLSLFINDPSFLFYLTTLHHPCTDTLNTKPRLAAETFLLLVTS
jgi:hypothetical protein